MAARASRRALRTLAFALVATSALSFQLPARGIVGLTLPRSSRGAAQGAPRGLPRVARLAAKPVRGASFLKCAAKTLEVGLLEDAYEVLNVADIGFDEAGLLLATSKLATARSGELLVEEGKDITIPSKERQVFLILSGTVKVSRGGNKLTKLQRGDFIGESRFLEVQALEKLQTLRVDPVVELFDSADSDNSGALDANEVAGAFKAAGIGISMEQAQQILDALDANSDGLVELSELQNMSSKVTGTGKAGLQQLFSQYDANLSGLLNAREVREMLMTNFKIDMSQEQAQVLIEMVSGRIGADLSLSDLLGLLNRLRDSQTLRSAFAEFDADASGRISTSELYPMLKSLNVNLSQEQVVVLVRSLDLNNDGEMDLQEFTSAISRIEDGVLGRFGSAIRLFEAVAFGTQRESQVSVVAESDVRYVVWTIRELQSALKNNPTIAAKMQAIWALKLSMKLKETTKYIGGGGMSGHEEGNPSATAGDYGFPSSFLWGSKGDFGPLDAAVPGSAMQMAFWQLGREYEGLRRAFRFGELRQIVEALSGADVWTRKAEVLKQKFGDVSDQELDVMLRDLFRSMDMDNSGCLSAEELRGALGGLGVDADARQVRAMLALADSDGDATVAEDEFVSVITSIRKGASKMQLALKRPEGNAMSMLIAAPLLFLIETVSFIDQAVEGFLEGKLQPQQTGAGADISKEEREERQRLQGLVRQLQLSNEAVTNREEQRLEQLQIALDKAREEVPSDAQAEIVRAIESTQGSPVIMVPYAILCWVIDVLFVNRPIQRFWFLENVARMPYLSYNTMLALYEVLGWWRVSSDARKVHFAEEWNEVQHLKILEALGGDSSWIDRFLGRHAALFYLLIMNHIWLFSPSFAYSFSELIEFHAVDTYGEFVDANEELLRRLPPPQEALDYFCGPDMYIFDEFQTGREPRSRRPKIESLYDVFCNIRDDELEHVKTMYQCQTAVLPLVSPNTVAANNLVKDKQHSARRAKTS